MADTEHDSEQAAEAFPSGNDGESSLAIEPGLYWTVKSSFVRYVMSGAAGKYSIADGVDVDNDGNFFFPLDSVHRDDENWSLQFRGDLRFSGHFGMLFVALIRPKLLIGPAGGSLVIDDVSTPGRAGTLAIAVIEPAHPFPYRGFQAWPPLIPALTAEGVELFGDVYPEGSPLDSLRVAIRDDGAPS